MEGKEEDAFYNSLQEIRRENVIQSEQVYHDMMATIVDNAIAELDQQIPFMKKELIENVAKEPHRRHVYVPWSLCLGPLFRIGKPAEHTLLFINKDNVTGGKEDVVTYAYSFNEIRGHSCELFSSYLLSQDPHMKRLRSHLRQAFPRADIIPIVDINYGKQQVRFTISYSFPPFSQTGIVHEVVNNHACIRW